MFSRFIHRLDNILLLISYYVSTKKDSSPKCVIFQTPRDYMTVQVYIKHITRCQTIIILSI